MFCATTIVSSSYYDSVVLMRVASQLKKRDGVSEVALFMGTEGNHDLLKQVGLATQESRAAGPEDLIIIVQAETESVAAVVGSEATSMLTSRSETDQDSLDYRPRTLERALDFLPDATLASISIPGEYAAREASRCLDKNLNVFLFSDNVSLEDEIRLKKKALAKGLLCMGPDCGTAYLGGVGLGFTNVVSRGRIGCVAASGTGLQAVVCRLAQRGEGVSHCIGVGGRDLSREAGGLMTRHGLELLDRNPETEIIILLSKPPDPEVLESLEETIEALHTPVVTCFQGSTTGTDQAMTLDDAAETALGQLNNEPFHPVNFDHPQKVRQLLAKCGENHEGDRVIGLFTGGTLAKEAHFVLQPLLGQISADFSETGSHAIVDLGDDRYTIGRPHPMIAPENRTEVLLELGARGELDRCGVLLFDLVLGHGSHHDPASELAQSIATLQDRHGINVPVIVGIIGTDGDPQSLTSQVTILEESGAWVFRKNSEAARCAALVVESRYREKILEEAA